jgi:WD40 repeat protein
MGAGNPTGTLDESGGLSVEQALLLEQACDAFEAKWRAGGRPDVGAALLDLPQELRSAAMRELVSLDMYYRREAGEHPTPAEYAARFPDLDPVALTADAAHPRVGPAFDDYELVGELGRGGMGVVYRARQRSLKRDVALKMLLAGPYASPAARTRFLIEAESVASLDHPHIVTVHAFGECGGLPYLVMEYLPGGSLVERRGKLDPKQTAAVLLKLADAVAAAHARGIVHRDLKPQNVLYTAAGEPKVTDFGLAKVGTSGVSASGAVIGTPSYMAPEQAAGRVREVGTAADVWALGAVLYDLLTGRPPFRGPADAATLQMVMTEEPVRPRALAPRVPRDLETVCLKCLQKDPARRYPTAAAVADELRRFGVGEPVEARPVGRTERAFRWARRKPALAAAYGLSAVAVALTGVVAGAVWLWQDAEAARGQAVTAQSEAEQARDKLAGANLQLDAARAEIEFLNYAHLVRLAFQEQQAGEYGNARARLAACPEHLRGWEWHYVHRLAHPDLITLRDEHAAYWAFSPDGRRVVAATREHTARVWDVLSGEEVPAHRVGEGVAPSRAFSPDGRRLVAVDDGIARVWDTLTGKELTVLRGHTDRGQRAAFSSDGRRIVTTNSDKTARVWEPDTGRELAVLRGHADVVWSAAFSPDGRRIVTGSGDGTARVWDALGGNVLAVLRGHGGTTTTSEGPRTVPIGNVWSAAFSPNGRRVVTAGEDGTARIWDALTGKQLRVLRGHWDRVISAAFSPDGRQAITAGVDHTARVWDTLTGKELTVLRGHGNGVYSAAFSPDGRHVLTTGWDKTARVWDLDARNAVHPLSGEEDRIWRAAFSPDGHRLVTAEMDGTARVRDALTGHEVRALRGHEGMVRAVAFSPDSRRVITGGTDGTARVWDPETGKNLTVLRGHRRFFEAVAFSPDGRRVTTVGDDGTARVWDPETGRELGAVRGHEGIVLSAEFSPDGRRVVTVGDDGTARAWDPETGRELMVLRGADAQVRSAAFSPDGRRVVTASEDHTARVWDLDSGRELVALRGHEHWVDTAAFSPDGRRVVTTSFDNTARVWDVLTGKELLALPGFGFAIFSPDGARLLIKDHGTVVIHDSTPINRAFLPSKVAPPPRPVDRP